MNCGLAAQIAPCWGGGCQTHRNQFLQSDLLVDLNRLDAALKQAVVLRCQHAGVLCPLSPPIPLWVDRPVNLSLGACNSGVNHASRSLVPSHAISLKREHWFLSKLLGRNVSAATCPVLAEGPYVHFENLTTCSHNLAKVRACTGGVWWRVGVCQSARRPLSGPC